MSETEGPDRVTALLGALERGEAGAANALLPIVCAELRRLPAARMARLPAGGAGQTLQPTALVHEVYLRLVARAGDAEWANRRHFFGAAAQAMRQILVEHARRRGSLKRGGDRGRVPLEDAWAAEPETDGATVDVVALDGALSRLAEQDPRKGEVVALRYFAGLSIEDTARAMGLSPATVKREWAMAKALLYDEIMESA